MEPNDKNVWDVVLNVITLIAAAVAFGVGIYQWGRSQAWQRAEKFDKLVERFESDRLLRLATVVLDWTERTVRFDERTLKVLNDEALLALRDHRDIEVAGETEGKEDAIKFPGEQAHLRDAYDAILAFFNRLEIAISTNLIDKEPAKKYFGYWLERLVTFDKHADNKEVLKGVAPRAAVAKYIRVYGDLESVKRLCDHFGVAAPEIEDEVKVLKKVKAREIEAEVKTSNTDKAS